MYDATSYLRTTLGSMNNVKVPNEIKSTLGSMNNGYDVLFKGNNNCSHQIDCWSTLSNPNEKH